MYASKNEAAVIRVIRALIAACLSIFPGAKRQMRRETEPADVEAMAPKRDMLKECAADFHFLLSIICVALMILLGLAIPAIVMTGLCLLLIEHRTRYRAALARKVTPV